MIFEICPDCYLPIGDSLQEVPCDGCHQYFHRRCLHYQLIDVEWDDQPKAYAFCRDCDE